MANTLGDIKTSIQNKGYATDTATAQASMINSVYRRVIGMRRWWFNEVPNNTSLTLATGTQSVSLAGITDFLHVDAVRISTASSQSEIEYVPPQELRDLYHTDRTNGEPLFWTRTGGSLYFWPVADQNYTVSVDYIKYPATLVADGDATIIPDAYQDVLVWGAIKELTFRERDAEGRSLAEDEFQTILATMRHQDGLEQRQTPSEVGYSGEVTSVNDRYVDPDEFIVSA